MIKVTITGDTPEAVFAQIVQLANKVAPGTYKEALVPATVASGSLSSQYGYLAPGAGRPTGEPVDDGTEWTEELIAEWVSGLNANGQRVVRRLAEVSFQYSLDEIQRLRVSGMTYSGWWAGPRFQAVRIARARRLQTWPYGHSDVGRRHSWMHPTIAARILAILKNGV